MQELEDLRKAIANQDYKNALLIIDELEEMSKEDKLNKIYSYLVVLLMHLIKQEIEQRSTSSWQRSILNSVDGINRTNKRRKSGGHYASTEVLLELIDEALPKAIREASYEVFEGGLTEYQIKSKLAIEDLKFKALALIENNN